MQFPEDHFYGDVYDSHVSVCFWSRDFACEAASTQSDGLPSRRTSQPAEIERRCLCATGVAASDANCFPKLLHYYLAFGRSEIAAFFSIRAK
jgi:hypothetical protein